MTFSAMMREQRRAQRVTFTALAKLVGYHASYLSLVERGLRVLDETGVVRVAEALHIDPTQALLASLTQRLPEELRQHVPADAAISDRLTPFEHARLLQAPQFDYQVGRVRSHGSVDWDGNLRLVRNFDDCRPNAEGRPISQIMFRERVVGVEPKIGDPVYPKLAVRQAPHGLEFQLETRKSSGWINHLIVFPDGWRRSSRQSEDSFCFTLETFQKNALLLDPSKRTERAQYETLQPLPTGSFAHHLVSFTQTMELSFEFPRGYEPERWQAWVWWGPGPFAAVTRNLAGKDHCRSFAFTREGGHARLVADQPLAGYHYAIVWTPADRQAYLEAKHGVWKD